MDFDTSVLLVTWGAILLLGFAMSGLVRQMHQLRQLVQGGTPITVVGPRPGERAPSPDGEAWTRSGVALFVDHGCSSCDRILPEFARLAELRSDLRFVALFRDDANGSRSPSVAIHPHQGRLFDELGITVLPFAISVTADGTVSHAAPVGSVAALQRLVGETEERMAKR
ncbi:MAG: TlpA family protein disulfide reductase [Actinomycetota bacterium]